MRIRVAAAGAAELFTFERLLIAEYAERRRRHDAEKASPFRSRHDDSRENSMTSCV